MACKNICRLCSKLILSTAIDYGTTTTGTLTVTIPAGSYAACEKYCIVIAQAIPAATVVDAPVQIRIGTGGAYPLQLCNGAQMTARTLKTRTKYSTVVVTSNTTGAFRLLGKVCPGNTADALTAIS